MRHKASAPIPSPNIWQHPETYEIECAACDPDGRLVEAMGRAADWAGADVLDIGCGSGVHLPFFALTARSVTGVEPFPQLAERARARVAGLPPAYADRVSVLSGRAEQLPLPSASIDVAHARWAYFFGPGCEPGLGELDRVLRPGGIAMIVDNDVTRSQFADWFRRTYPRYSSRRVERFFSRRCWHRTSVDMDWLFTSRADLEAVLDIELTAAAAAYAKETHRGLRVSYAVNLWTRSF